MTTYVIASECEAIQPIFITYKFGRGFLIIVQHIFTPLRNQRFRFPNKGAHVVASLCTTIALLLLSFIFTSFLFCSKWGFGGFAPDDSSHLIIRVFLFRFHFFFFHRNKKEKVNKRNCLSPRLVRDSGVFNTK